MVELATALAVSSLFLLWRLLAVKHKLHMAETMLWGVIEGKVTITKTTKGVEMEIKNNG